MSRKVATARAQSARSTPRSAAALGAVGLGLLCVSQFVDVLSVNTVRRGAFGAGADRRPRGDRRGRGAHRPRSARTARRGADEARRPRALGWWTAAGAGGGIAGLALGGVITDLAGWRAAFVAPVLVPLAAGPSDAIAGLRLAFAGTAAIAAAGGAAVLVMLRSPGQPSAP